MNLADKIAVAAAAGAFLGGFGGTIAPFRTYTEAIDNAERGAFVGAYFGSLLGAMIDFAGLFVHDTFQAGMGGRPVWRWKWLDGGSPREPEPRAPR